MGGVARPQVGGPQAQGLVCPQVGGPQAQGVVCPQVGGTQAQGVVCPQVGGPQAQGVARPQVGGPQAQGLVRPQVGDQEVGLQEEGLQVGLLLSRLRFSRDTRRWCLACCMPCPSSRLALLFPSCAVSGRSDRTVRPPVRPLPRVMLALALTPPLYWER